MKQFYTAPELVVVSFKVENGFVGSGAVGSPLNLDFDFQLFDESEDKNQAASYTESNWDWGF